MIRVPPLSPEKVAEYSGLFEKSGAENGMLSGITAKQIFERARLPNELLGRIWNLSDTQGRGSLDVTEFVIAMHLLASCKSGQMRGVPNTLPPGLYEAAMRRPPPPGQRGPGSRPGSAQPAIAPQFSGYGRPQSPITRAQAGTPLSQQSTGDGWVVSPADKGRFDSIFNSIDKPGSGYISGEQAVEFFGNARLPEEVLAQIWDLADINSEGRLDKDEFAVAMYLIRQQRGTKDGRGNLPQVLPPALIPPSRRKQQIPPSHPTAPAFENAAPTKPKSAADDLFGLDAFGPPPVAQQQVAQSTGGTDGGPFANPPMPSSPSASNQFRPFVPTSSFGRSLEPQSTGSPVPAHAPVPPQSRSVTHDDLLGDADPGETSRITNDTSELANLSNQVGNLSKQMTDLHTTRGQAEQELNQTSAQKRAFESRLGQLRQLYEKEVKEVKALKDQLASAKTDTKRLQQDYAMIDGSHQDLSTQHQQLRQQFETDQRENAGLKEKIRQMNAEVESLKPQLEKLKSDARQQKGLVAINKKQLATNEAERDRINAEIATAQKEIADHAREAEESARAIENSQKEIEQARSTSESIKNTPIASPRVNSPPVSREVVSPAPSTSSNPFFRRAPSEQIMTPEPQPQHSQSAFDNIFGPSFGTVAPAPATSFDYSDSPAHADTPPVEVSRDFSGTPQVMEPPAPPADSQITSSSLPFPHSLSRGESVTSSVRVAPPISRLSPDNSTPRALTPTSSSHSPEDIKHVDQDPFAPSAQDEEQESVQRTIPTGEKSTEEMFGEPSMALDLPGAFPGGDTPRAQTPHVENPGLSNTAVAAGVGAAAAAAGVGAAVAMNGEDKGKAPADKDDNFDQYFGGAAHQRTASQQAADFDSAFAGMKTEPAANGTRNQEFPDIKEMDSDSESESSEEPMAFDDDFNKAKEPENQPEVASALPSHLAPPRPQLTQTPSAGSSLPDFSTQTPPPPDYQNAAGENPNHFAREFQGLLPERGDPTSPPAGGETIHHAATESPDYGPEVGHAQNAGASPPPIAATKPGAFDFDSAFAGVGPAQVEDDSSDDDDEIPQQRHQSTDFDPSFDSPAVSATVASSSAAPSISINNAAINGSPSPPPRNDFFDFNTDSVAPPVAPPAGTGNPQTSHDWDDIFSGLSKDTAPKPTVAFENDGDRTPTLATQATAISPTALALTKSREIAPTDSPVPEPAKPVVAAQTSPTLTSPLNKVATLQPEPDRPALGRAVSTTSEHDDPIVKRLTSMGFSRNDTVTALEKYDYDIDKAADWLTFRD